MSGIHCKYFFVFLLSIVSLSLVAQKKVWVKFGDQSMEAHDAYSAAKFYEKALVYDSLDYSVQYKLAKAYMSYQNYPKALPLCLSLNGKQEFPLLNYDLGKIYKYAGEFDSSLFYFSAFVKHGDKSLEEQDWAKNEIENFPKVLDLLKDSAVLKFEHLKGTINTGESEFASFSLNDSTLIYTSLKATSVKEDGTVKDDDYHASLYFAKKQDSLWLMDEKVKLANSKAVSFANGSFNGAKTKLYFSICEQFGACVIYEGNFKGDSLTDIKPLPEQINALESSSTQPHFVELLGRKFLFFSSNRIGGKGGMDLWVSEYKNNWGTAKNLGLTINTKGNEVSPFYDVDKNELYFSSDWHYNLGGFDIFKASGTFPSNWKDVVNVGIPYNSNLNDLYYSKQDSLIGFFTSSRAGSVSDKDAACCNDIYRFEELPEVIESIDEKKPLFSNVYEFRPTVYFHNDRPNKDSWDTTTALNYETTYQRYVPLFEEYKNEFSAQFKLEQQDNARKQVESFFKENMLEGYQYLLKFSDRLIQELDSGRSVELTLKGFASPLTKSDYNVNLSKRRISSVVNFLTSYKGGVLNKYIDGTAANKAKLSFYKNPNGEFKAKEGVSDDYYDVRNSIYNPAAALERKVELYADLTFMDSVPVFSLSKMQHGIPELTFNLLADKEEQRVKLYLYNDADSFLIIQQIEGKGIKLDNTDDFKELTMKSGELKLVEFVYKRVALDELNSLNELIVQINGQVRILRLNFNPK